ncbi:MAG: hypothetical protein AAFW47_01175 [Pseudomonadota bacterium]
MTFRIHSSLIVMITLSFAAAGFFVSMDHSISANTRAETPLKSPFLAVRAELDNFDPLADQNLEHVGLVAHFAGRLRSILATAEDTSADGRPTNRLPGAIISAGRLETYAPTFERPASTLTNAVLAPPTADGGGDGAYERVTTPKELQASEVPTGQVDRGGTPSAEVPALSPDTSETPTAESPAPAPQARPSRDAVLIASVTPRPREARDEEIEAPVIGEGEETIVNDAADETEVEAESAENSVTSPNDDDETVEVAENSPDTSDVSEQSDAPKPSVRPDRSPVTTIASAPREEATASLAPSELVARANASFSESVALSFAPPEPLVFPEALNTRPELAPAFAAVERRPEPAAQVIETLKAAETVDQTPTATAQNETQPSKAEISGDPCHVAFGWREIATFADQKAGSNNGPAQDPNTASETVQSVRLVGEGVVTPGPIYRDGKVERANFVPSPATRCKETLVDIDVKRSRSAGVMDTSVGVVRVADIQPLDKAARCPGREDQKWLCGGHARVKFKQFVQGQRLQCRIVGPETGTDQNPAEAHCLKCGVDVADWVVSQGWAFSASTGRHRAAQDRAEAQGIGMWADRPPTTRLTGPRNCVTSALR